MLRAYMTRVTSIERFDGYNTQDPMSKITQLFGRDDRDIFVKVHNRLGYGRSSFEVVVQYEEFGFMDETRLKMRVLDAAQVPLDEMENVNVLNLENDQTELWMSFNNNKKGFSVVLNYKQVSSQFECLNKIICFRSNCAEIKKIIDVGLGADKKSPSQDD